MSTYDFENALKRVFEAAECRTQVELREFLQVRQSSVSDAKSRKSIPAEWLIKLLDKKQVNPNWVLYGECAKYLGPIDSEQCRPHVVRITEVRPPEECTAQALVNELVRRALEPLCIEEIQKQVAASWFPVKK